MNSCLRITQKNFRLYKNYSFKNSFSTSLLRYNDNRNIFEAESTEKKTLIETPEDFPQIPTKDYSRLVKVKAYKPPTNVEDIIKEICQKTLGQQFHEKNFKTFNFTDPLFKFQILVNCISNFKHDIPSSKLNEIKNVQDLIEYYLIEQKDTSSLEDLAQAENLPPNLHINLEYNRFNPETDTFFEGKDAFPKRDTLAPSLWYSKKYKPVIKKKEMFNK